MKESNFQSIWGKYLRKNGWATTLCYELKITKSNCLPFSAVKGHQIEGLRSAVSGLHHKISDSPIFPEMKTRFTKPKPFDGMYIRDAQTLIGILYYIPHKRKIAHFLLLDSFINESEVSKRKSLTFERAKDIAVFSLDLAEIEKGVV
jgi:hypothetical protein